MDDDFNTPQALAVLYGLATEINRAKTENRPADATRLATELRSLAAVLGIAQRDPEAFLRKAKPRIADAEFHSDGRSNVDLRTVELTDAEIEALIDERAAARSARNFAESDRIRDRLAASGVILEDRPGQRSAWRRGR
jgi:cysteinyl-tRNA synthetase